MDRLFSLSFFNCNMSCSKIFLGDLPELTNEVIQYFWDDSLTLHSCILVNRLWCHLAIPLLWEDPFSISTENYQFIEIYSHNLNQDDKIKLNDKLIKIFSSNMLILLPFIIVWPLEMINIRLLMATKAHTFSTLPLNIIFLQNSAYAILTLGILLFLFFKPCACSRLDFPALQ